MKQREPLHSQCLVSRPPAWSGHLCHASCVVPDRDALQPVQTMEGKTIQRLPLGLSLFFALHGCPFHHRVNVSIPVGIALAFHAHTGF